MYKFFKDGNVNEFQGDFANINVLKERRKKFNCNTSYSSFVSNPRPFNSILHSPVLLVTFHKDYQIPELSTLFLLKHLLAVLQVECYDCRFVRYFS